MHLWLDSRAHTLNQREEQRGGGEKSPHALLSYVHSWVPRTSPGAEEVQEGAAGWGRQIQTIEMGLTDVGAGIPSRVRCCQLLCPLYLYAANRFGFCVLPDIPAFQYSRIRVGKGGGGVESKQGGPNKNLTVGSRMYVITAGQSLVYCPTRVATP